MEREDSSRYVNSRISLWCSVCGAQEGHGCKPVGGLRFKSHDENALGTVPRPVIPVEWVTPRKDAPARKPYTPRGWVQ
jgi:hypothetical protein